MPLQLRPWIDGLTIKTTSLQYRRLDLDFVDPDPTIGDWGWAQRPYVREIERQYNLGKPVRIQTLKARQLGLSTASEAVLFVWCFIHPGTNALVLAHEDKASQRLYQMTRLFWDRWEFNKLFIPQYKTRRQLRWAETESQLEVATAKNPESQRSGTFNAVHASEVAFWDNPEVLWTGLRDSVPRRHKTLIVLESTANGVGNWWHEQWLAAEAQDSEFVPMFFPWFGHSAYRQRGTGLRRQDLDEEESALLALMAEPISYTRGTVLDNHGDPYDLHPGLGADEGLAALAWRRTEVRAKGLDKFHQEMPSCVTGETLVGSSRGLRRIDTITQGDRVTMGSVIESHQQPPSTIWKLTTKDGFMLRGTWDHPVFLDSGLLQPLSTLKSGDRIKLCAPRLATHYHTESWEDLGVRHSLLITEEWGRLLGFYMGDGCYNNDSLSISCDARDQDAIDEVLKLLGGTMGLEGHVRVIGPNKGGRDIRTNSVKIKGLFDRLGLLRRNSSGLLKRNVRVPDVIWNSPPSVVREFLRGLFEADGFSGYAYPRIVLFSKDLEFLGHVQLLLLALGVVSKRTSRPTKTGKYEYQANELLLNGDRARAFDTRVGFVSERKSHPLKVNSSGLGRKPLSNDFVSEVAEVVEDGFESTFDLTVEDGAAFDANGILTHNTPEEAFISTGNPVFPPSAIQACYEPMSGVRGALYRDSHGRVAFDEQSDGDLRIYRKPSSTPDPNAYFVAADPSENRHQGDPACIQVIRRRDNHQVAVWHSHSDPIVVARQMILLGDFYHRAMLCPEVEGGGQATIGAILQAGYPNVWSWKKPDRTTRSFNVWGWSTNYNTKMLAVTDLNHLLMTGSITIHDKLTYIELLNFVEHPNGTLGNSSNSPHDDTVMALAISVAASKLEGHFAPNQQRTPALDIFSSEFEQSDDPDNIVVPLLRRAGY